MLLPPDLLSILVPFLAEPDALALARASRYLLGPVVAAARRTPHLLAAYVARERDVPVSHQAKLGGAAALLRLPRDPGAPVSLAPDPLGRALLRIRYTEHVDTIWAPGEEEHQDWPRVEVLPPAGAAGTAREFVLSRDWEDSWRCGGVAFGIAPGVHGTRPPCGGDVDLMLRIVAEFIRGNKALRVTNLMGFTMPRLESHVLTACG